MPRRQSDVERALCIKGFVADCPLDRDAYETILVEGKWIDPPLSGE